MDSKVIDKVGILATRLRELILRHDAAAAKSELADERPEDLADALVSVDPEEASGLLMTLDPELAANVMVELPTETTRQISHGLTDEVLAHYLDILPMDDAIDLREDIGEERFDALLNVIPADDAREIQRLLAYPEGSVGRIMTEKFFWCRPEMSISEILADMRRASEDKYESIHDIYVVDDGMRLVGVTSLRRVLRVPQKTLVSEIMRAEPISVVATEEDEAAARIMARYGFYALPVVSQEGSLVGILTGDDAQVILREAETEDVLAVSGVSGAAEPYLSLTVWQLYLRRVPWLGALFVAETLTGNVLRYYGQNASSLGVTSVMYFVPLLIGAGGNAGAQVTTTVIRALALDEVRSRDWLKVLGRELLVALSIGATLGALGYARALFGWKSGWEMSLVVGIALPCIVVWASIVGSVLPLGAKRLGIDPAVMSAPFITTFVDATGLVIYFEIARRLIQG